MSFITSFLLGALLPLLGFLFVIHFYLKGYLKGFLDSHNKDITFLSKLPKLIKDFYKIKINE